MDDMYPLSCRIFATGGAIGDCLFLFCSGFTLFMGQMKSFDNYYKRRINRIYPSVFAAILFVHLLNGRTAVEAREFYIDPGFVTAIMVYYIILWFVRKYLINKIMFVLFGVVTISLLIYIFWFPYKYETSSNGLYGTLTLYRWIPYFAMMLSGAYIGINKEQIKFNIKLDTVKLFVCLLLFYGIQLAAKKVTSIAPLQIITLLPLFGIVIYLYKICNSYLFEKIYNNKICNWLIMVIGGLCLESYLIQFSLFTTKFNDFFPLNLVLIGLLILICAYFVRCLARLFSQTFRTEDYEWKAIFKLS